MDRDLQKKKKIIVWGTIILLSIIMFTSGRYYKGKKVVAFQYDKVQLENRTEKIQSNKDITSTYSSISTEDLPIKDRIEKYLGSEISKFGFIYYDLNTGEKISINENKVFVAASSYKVGLNIITIEEARNGRISLDEGVTYLASNDYEDGTGILQNQIDTTLTKPLSMRRLQELSITHSDNIATRMINRRLGGTQSVRNRINNLVGLSCDTTSNKTTAEIQFRLLKRVYDNRNSEGYLELIENMKSTLYHDRLDKYIPNDLVAHKVGNYGTAVNDIGIVFTEKPYIIVAYCEGMSNSYENIAIISEMIYKDQLKK